MKITRYQLRRVIEEELQSVYDPALGYDVDVETAGPDIPELSSRHAAILKNRYGEYIKDHKAMVADRIISRGDDEYVRSAQNFINYLMLEPGSRQVDLSDLAQSGYDAGGIAFFNNIGIPLKEHSATKAMNVNKRSGKEKLDEGALDWLQGGLDIVGLIPGIGEAADAVNAIISLARGNPLEALLSGISMIPGAGDAVGKGGKIVVKVFGPAMDLIKRGDDVAKIVKKIGPEALEKSKWAIELIKDTAVKYGPQLQELFKHVKAKDLEALEAFAGFKVPDVARKKATAALGKAADALPEAEIQSIFKFLAKLDIGDMIGGTDDYKKNNAADAADAAGKAVDAGVGAVQKLAAGYVHNQSLGRALFGEVYINEMLVVYGNNIEKIVRG